MKTKLINNSHLKRHVSADDVREIKTIIRLQTSVAFKYMEVLQYVERKNHTLHRLQKTACFNVYEALEAVTTMKSKHKAFVQEALLKVVGDHVKYGDEIPNTSDTAKPKLVEYDAKTSFFFKQNRDKRVELKRIKQTEIAQRLNAYWCNNCEYNKQDPDDHNHVCIDCRAY